MGTMSIGAESPSTTDDSLISLPAIGRNDEQQQDPQLPLPPGQGHAGYGAPEGLGILPDGFQSDRPRMRSSSPHAQRQPEGVGGVQGTVTCAHSTVRGIGSRPKIYLR